jgi:hypothetical protein
MALKELNYKPHFYAFGDHGGLIVAAKQQELTGGEIMQVSL